MAQKKLAQEYVDSFVEYSKPGAGYKLAAKDIAKVMPKFSRDYEAKATSKDKREGEFNKMALAFMANLYGIGYDNPEVAGGQLKNILSKAPEGILAKIYTAIERGDKLELKAALKQGLEAFYQNQKLETTLTDARNQPDDVRVAYSKGLVSLVGDVDGYKGSYVTALENPTLVLQGLAQRLALAESVAKTKPVVDSAITSTAKDYVGQHKS